MEKIENLSEKIKLKKFIQICLEFYLIHKKV